MTKERITTLEDIDKKILEQQQRQKEKVEETSPIPEDMIHTPFTDMMQDAFKENIAKSQKCFACKWQNYGKFIVLMNNLDVMRERLPLPTIICGQCGTLFVPKWVRKIANQAIDQENTIINQTVGAEAGV